MILNSSISTLDNVLIPEYTVLSNRYLLLADVFKFDPNFEEHEEEYKRIKREILDEGSSDEGGSGSGSGSGSDDDSSDEEGEDGAKGKLL
jgi:hypothetical protein